MLFAQKSRDQDYLEQCDKAVASGLQQLVSVYYFTRAVFLGQPVPTGQTMPNGAPQFSISGDPNFKLRDRITALGTKFGAAMMKAELLRQFTEAQIAEALADVGGITNVRQNGSLGFLLGLAERDSGGNVIGYKGLESNPFKIKINSNVPGQPPQEITVELIVKEDGTGDVTFSGPQASTDPL